MNPKCHNTNFGKSEITENEVTRNGMTPHNQELTEHGMTQYEMMKKETSQTKWREKIKQYKTERRIRNWST